MADLRTSGAHLHELLVDIAEAHPGVPIDVIAHSQGGLVVRQALTAAAPGEELPVDHVITLASPHHGAPAARLAGTLGLSEGSSTLGPGVAAATAGGIDPGAASVAQMAEGSAFLADLQERALPDGIDLTSVAGAGDLVVPATSSTVGGATNALVDLGGPAAHSRLPGSPEAHREIALALGDMAPTCVPTATLAAGVATAALVTTGEHALGAAAPAAVLVDRVAGLLVDLAGAA
jgi:alpha-beta hydrolase superfamily lysophospholipase